MDQQREDLLEILNYIEPGQLDYQDWCNVGMALKHEGYTASCWDEWSKRDLSRYKAGECFKKWESFRGAGTPVTAGTIVAIAKDQGWSPERDSGYELDWDAMIGPKDELKIIDQGWVEAREVAEPKEWDPAKDLIRYIETIFESSENVGYVTGCWEKEGRFLPQRGSWDRTAGELIQALYKCRGDICSVLGDYNPAAGAWIRFNPMDGKGCKNDNVTDYRFALVESDHMDIDKQNAIIRELELPVAALVFSGGKSLHAIVRIEAASYEEYRKRVDYLYNVLNKNGMRVDTQNKNPSRLSRLPGAVRDGHKQFLVDTNIGKPSWAEWYEWIESVNDDLPDPESLANVIDNLPDLAPALIDGVLRQGHKLLLAGPSKAGKSYALIQLCIAIAEGRKWLDFDCAKGKVMYVNLELDRASCLHRFKDVYMALDWPTNNLQNIDIWNLRGRAVPMDKLAPKLIRRAAKKEYLAIIIDPIYKVITGDENSANQMAEFCNQFDLVCHKLGAAVIYCHHHSKGQQGQKRSMDRASGSGVFARDPDALLDMMELEITEALIEQETNKAVCAVCIDHLDKFSSHWEDHASQDDMCSQKSMLRLCDMYLPADNRPALEEAVRAAKKAIEHRSAYRIEGTLREFPKFSPVNLWFDYPVHHVERTGSLKDVNPEGELPTHRKKKTPADFKKERMTTLETAFDALMINGAVTINDLMTYTGLTRNTIKNYIDEHEDFEREKDGTVKRGCQSVKL